MRRVAVLWRDRVFGHYGIVIWTSAELFYPTGSKSADQYIRHETSIYITFLVAFPDIG
jgi:hypothetical protein